MLDLRVLLQACHVSIRDQLFAWALRSVIACIRGRRSAQPMFMHERGLRANYKSHTLYHKDSQSECII